MSRAVVERIEVRLAIARDVLAPIRDEFPEGDEVRSAVDEVLAKITLFERQVWGRS